MVHGWVSGLRRRRRMSVWFGLGCLDRRDTPHDVLARVLLMPMKRIGACQLELKRIHALNSPDIDGELVGQRTGRVPSGDAGPAMIAELGESKEADVNKRQQQSQPRASASGQSVPGRGETQRSIPAGGHRRGRRARAACLMEQRAHMSGRMDRSRHGGAQPQLDAVLSRS